MNWMDDQLRSALARQPAPPDLAGRVLARARRPSLWNRWGLIAAAAMLIVSLSATWWVREREERRRIEAANAHSELLYALEVTAGKLYKIKAKVVERGEESIRR